VTYSPASGPQDVVDRMSATTASRVTSGRPPQFCVIWEKSRCSILFHLLVPGGKWQTLTLSPVVSASLSGSALVSRVQSVP
jgi:hypothetical protein